MRCRWVTDSRLTTLGRRVVITSAVFGLTTIGGAGVAVAAAGEIGHSPANPVVQIAPTAVSVTFGEPLRHGGARMRVLNAGADVGTGEVTTAARTLRRELRASAPHGAYLVEWTAVSASGQKLSGRFRFTAARGNGEALAPPPAVVSPAQPTATPTPSVAPTPRAEPSATRPATSATRSATPAATRSATASSTPTGTPDWISGQDPVWTPQPTVPATALAYPGEATPGSSVSSGFTAVPLVMGGLLVLAAGLVSLFNRPRLRG